MCGKNHTFLHVMQKSIGEKLKCTWKYRLRTYIDETLDYVYIRKIPHTYWRLTEKSLDEKHPVCHIMETSHGIENIEVSRARDAPRFPSRERLSIVRRRQKDER